MSQTGSFLYSEKQASSFEQVDIYVCAMERELTSFIGTFNTYKYCIFTSKQKAYIFIYKTIYNSKMVDIIQRKLVRLRHWKALVKNAFNIL